MSMTNYLFVFNQLSGKQNNRTQTIQNIITALKHINIFNTHYIVIEKKDVDYNAKVLESIEKNNISHLILFGGDGTFYHITNFIYQQKKHLLEKLIFGFFPMGSGNGLAYHLQMPHSVNTIIDIIKKNNIQTIDAFIVNQKKIILHNIGIGFDALIAHQFNKSKKRGGWLYTFLIFKNIFNIKKNKIKIKIDDKEYYQNMILCCITNTNQFGMQLKIAPFAKINDGKIDVVIVPYQSFLMLLYRILQFLFFPKFNNNFSNSCVKYIQTKKIIIDNVNTFVHASGEIFPQENTIECEVLPNFIKCLHS